MSKITNMLFGIGLILFGIASAINSYLFQIGWLGLCAVFSPIIGIIYLILSYILNERLNSNDIKSPSEKRSSYIKEKQSARPVHSQNYKFGG